METDDGELLKRITAGDGNESFARLARRYSDMVYSAARRQLGDVHLAEDVTQAVFLLLVRKASSLSGDSLAAWLLRVTFFICRDARKAQSRRTFYEAKAGRLRMQNDQQRQQQPAWDDYASEIDEAGREGSARIGTALSAMGARSKKSGRGRFQRIAHVPVSRSLTSRFHAPSIDGASKAQHQAGPRWRVLV